MPFSRSIVPNPRPGIWDCLTSQQCVDVVRLLISQGKDLPEIAEIICELCLAPDTESGAGIGCDNMTILVVALLNGKTKDQWKAWVTERVKNHVGHATPEAIPQLYSQNRLMAFKARRAAEEARGMGARPIPENNLSKLLGRGPPSPHDTDSDDSDDAGDSLPTFGAKHGPITNSSLTRLQLNGGAGRSSGLGVNMDQVMTPGSFTAPPRQITTPLKSLLNGTTMEHQPSQFESLPGSDEASPVVKAEGLMDTSENPFEG